MLLLHCSFDRHALELLERMLTLDPSQVSLHLTCLSTFCPPFLPLNEQESFTLGTIPNNLYYENLANLDGVDPLTSTAMLIQGPLINFDLLDATYL